MTITYDFYYNLFYKFRFWFYRNFKPTVLKDYSSVNKIQRELTFFDGFTDKSWSEGNETLWKIGEYWGLVHPNKANVYYGEPTLVGSSVAAFTVKYKPKTFDIGGKLVAIPFEVSLLSSNFKQQYGRFECRCTIPYQKGIWPAFWLWGETWPPEIDVFELYGRKNGKSAGVQEMCVHYGNEKSGIKNIGAKKVKIDSYKKPNRFHEFAIEWTKDKIEFFTDGVKICRYTNKKILDKWYNIDSAKMHMIINHSIVERYVKNNETNYFSEFLVDYIRAYAPMRK